MTNKKWIIGDPNVVKELQRLRAEYRKMNVACTKCGSESYTRFRYFNNIADQIKSYAERGEAPPDVAKLAEQACFACKSPHCLQANPGKAEVLFTYKPKRKTRNRKPKPPLRQVAEGVAATNPPPPPLPPLRQVAAGVAATSPPPPPATNPPPPPQPPLRQVAATSPPPPPLRHIDATSPPPPPLRHFAATSPPPPPPPPSSAAATQPPDPTTTSHQIINHYNFYINCSCNSTLHHVASSSAAAATSPAAAAAAPPTAPPPATSSSSPSPIHGFPNHQFQIPIFNNHIATSAMMAIPVAMATPPPPSAGSTTTTTTSYPTPMAASAGSYHDSAPLPFSPPGLDSFYYYNLPNPPIDSFSMNSNSTSACNASSRFMEQRPSADAFNYDELSAAVAQFYPWLWEANNYPNVKKEPM